MDSPEFIEILKKKITELPRNNFFLLTQAINLLVLITANSAFNKMSTQVIIILFNSFIYLIKQIIKSIIIKLKLII